MEVSVVALRVVKQAARRCKLSMQIVKRGRRFQVEVCVGVFRFNHCHRGNIPERDNVSDHRAAANDIVFKSRAARGSVCIVLLSRALFFISRAGQPFVNI